MQTKPKKKLVFRDVTGKENKQDWRTAKFETGAQRRKANSKAASAENDSRRRIKSAVKSFRSR